MPPLTTLFDAMDVPLGPQTYAEHFDPDTFLKMPANALVNVGYLVVGGWWLWRSFRPDLRARDDVWFFRAFAVLALAYAPVQFARIVTQERVAGIADQWLTLPFFALVTWWAARLLGWSAASRGLAGPAFMAASFASYLLAAILPRGFESVLAVHIVLAVSVAVPLLARASGRYPAWWFAAAVVCCALFVGLKKLDFELAELGLTRLTGHFWSKVADFLQIHFAALFFAACNGAKRP